MQQMELHHLMTATLTKSRILVQETISQTDGGAVRGNIIIYVNHHSQIYAMGPETVQAPEFPPVLAIPIFIGATTIVVIALKEKTYDCRTTYN